VLGMNRRIVVLDRKYLSLVSGHLSLVIAMRLQMGNDQFGRSHKWREEFRAEHKALVDNHLSWIISMKNEK
jgi:hypothetical protein